jgi:hypothetical protein
MFAPRQATSPSSATVIARLNGRGKLNHRPRPNSLRNVMVKPVSSNWSPRVSAWAQRDGIPPRSPAGLQVLDSIYRSPKECATRQIPRVEQDADS